MNREKKAHSSAVSSRALFYLKNSDKKVFVIVVLLALVTIGLASCIVKNQKLQQPDEKVITLQQESVSVTSLLSDSVASPAKCSIADTSLYKVQPGDEKGWCKLFVLNGGYKLLYPEDWIFSILGSLGTNVAFNEDAKNPLQRDLFILKWETDLPLEELDQAFIQYEFREDPIVKWGEKVISKEVRRVENIEVLVLTTSQSQRKITRYFKKMGNRLWIFEHNVSVAFFDSEEHIRTLKAIEKIIVSTELLNETNRE